MRRDDLIPIGSPRPAALVALAVWSLLGACSAPAEARVTRIVVDEKRSPAYDGESFGRAGTYERIIGRVFGELDPRDRRNAVITDLDLAPRNARGMVEYVATFTLWQPTDPAKASGVLIYAVPNRGNRLFFPAFHLGGEPGDGFFFRRGDAILMSGWQGDVVAAGRRDDHRPGGEERRRFQHHRPGARTFRRHAGRYADALTPLGERAGRSRYRAGDPHPPGRRGRRRHPDRTRRLGVRRLPQGPVPRHARPDAPVGERRVRPGLACTNWSTPRRTRRCSASGWRRHATWCRSFGMRTGPTKARVRRSGGRCRTSSPRASRRPAISSARSSTSDSTRTSPAGSCGTGRTPTSPPASSPSTSGSPGPAAPPACSSRAARACCGGATTRTGHAA